MLAIIGGTGITSLEGLIIERRQVVYTPYGAPSGPVVHGIYNGKSLIFLPRHGYDHRIPPHQINYRANLWCLHHVGVTNILAFAAVGGIHPEMKATDLVIPHQLIDYTYGRFHTFFENDPESSLNQPVTHIDFTDPYCQTLRERLIQTAKQIGLSIHEQGVYAATQGPRLETIAEINKLEKDGCDMVGMTGMPEAALARELEMCYASCAIIANPAAGRGSPTITMAEVEANLKIGVTKARQLLAAVIETF